MTELFEPLTKKDHEALTREGERLIRFMTTAEAVEDFKIQFTEL